MTICSPRFTDPAGNERLPDVLRLFPTETAPAVSAAFDQGGPDPPPPTLSLVLPAGWDCLANGPVTGRAAGRGGRGCGRFRAGERPRGPWDLTIAAGAVRARLAAARAGPETRYG